MHAEAAAKSVVVAAGGGSGALVTTQWRHWLHYECPAHICQLVAPVPALEVIGAHGMPLKPLVQLRLADQQLHGQALLHEPLALRPAQWGVEGGGAWEGEREHTLIHGGDCART